MADAVPGLVFNYLDGLRRNAFPKFCKDAASLKTFRGCQNHGEWKTPPQKGDCIQKNGQVAACFPGPAARKQNHDRIFTRKMVDFKKPLAGVARTGHGGQWMSYIAGIHSPRAEPFLFERKE